MQVNSSKQRVGVLNTLFYNCKDNYLLLIIKVCNIFCDIVRSMYYKAMKVIKQTKFI